jgi:hypothetical protein
MSRPQPNSNPTPPSDERAKRLLRCYEIIERAYRAEVAKAAAVLCGQTKEDVARQDDKAKA